MSKTKTSLKCFIISDFNTDTFSGYLKNAKTPIKLQPSAVPFGQHMPALLDSEQWTKNTDIAIVWTRPEAIASSFQKILNLEKVDLTKLRSEVENFTSLIQKFSGSVKNTFVPTWTVTPEHRTLEVTNALQQMNSLLIEKFSGNANVTVLDTQAWVENIGRNAFNDKLWYFSKNPFGNDLYKTAVSHISQRISVSLGFAKKLVIVDLDDTLWGGIVGDIGWQKLKLGGHDPLGESYSDFQKTLKSLKQRGILLGIVSKNEESTALEAIRSNPEMILKESDFSGWKINWSDKAQNILELTKDLNLGLQSVVFIDDNPVERDRVREALPEVLVPDWPTDKTKYKSSLLNLINYFEEGTTAEDSRRTEMYLEEKQREKELKTAGSVSEWLKTLDMKIKFEELKDENLSRIVQLFNKTNQMNLSTRRLSESELLTWMKAPNRKLWSVKVSDKFGNSGLTGIISVEIENKKAKIVDFILSCRVMGRKVEETMLHIAIEHAISSGNVEEIVAEYRKTDKNKPCLDFMKRSGMEFNEDKGYFTWSGSKKYPLPGCIDLV